jgi:aspartate racemase
MKTVGIVGGTGPESTVDYYRRIIATCRERIGEGSYPPILINSIDSQRMLRLVAEGELGNLTEWLLGEIARLARAEADFGVFAANTPHIVFEELRSASPIPLLSIVEATCNAAEAIGLRRAALFGTRFTMRGTFYAEVFGKRGIEVIAPPDVDATFIHETYMNELLKNLFLPESRERMLSIAERMHRENGIDAVILGGTEIPLLLRGGRDIGIPFLDTTTIHVERIVAEMLA